MLLKFTVIVCYYSSDLRLTRCYSIWHRQCTWRHLRLAVSSRTHKLAAPANDRCGAEETNSPGVGYNPGPEYVGFRPLQSAAPPDRSCRFHSHSASSTEGTERAACRCRCCCSWRDDWLLPAVATARLVSTVPTDRWVAAVLALTTVELQQLSLSISVMQPNADTCSWAGRTKDCRVGPPLLLFFF